MKIQNIQGTALFPKEKFISTETLVVETKFRSLSFEDLQWLWFYIRREFIEDIKSDFFLEIEVNEKRVKESIISDYNIVGGEEWYVLYSGEYKDEKFGKIRSFSGADRRATEKAEKGTVERGLEQFRLKKREKFGSDEEYLEYVRSMVKKEGHPVKSNFVFPDINFIFSYEKTSADRYRAHFLWNIKGYLLNYELDELAKELYFIFKRFADRIPETIGNIFCGPCRRVNEGPPFCMELYNGIRDRYDALPSEIFLLGGIEWLNYIPYSIMRENDRNNHMKVRDENVIITESRHGRFYIFAKPIRTMTIADRKDMRRKYLNPYLMKGKDFWYTGPESDMRMTGEKLPIYDEELQIIERLMPNGKTEYLIEYSPQNSNNTVVMSENE